MKKSIKITIAFLLVLIIIAGYFIGQIPMLNNRAEQYDDLLYSFEYRVNESLNLAQAYGVGISSGARDMCSAASLYYGEAIFILGADLVDLDYSETERELLYNYSKYIKIIYDDLSLIEDDAEYFDSEAYAVHTKIRQVYMPEIEKNRPMTTESSNQDWTFVEGLSDMLKTDLGEEMMTELENYMADHRNYDPYGEYNLN